MTEDTQGDTEFDIAARRILQDLPVPVLAPVHPPRRDFLRRGLALAMGLATVGTGAWVATSYAATPRIVRLALDHGAEEEMLRGVLVPDMAPVLRALSLPPDRAFPGILQLCKDCMVGPYPAWHLNAFMDNLGAVQVFVFRSPVPDAHGRGWWFGQHWRFLPVAGPAPLLLLSRRALALDAMAAGLPPPA